MELTDTPGYILGKGEPLYYGRQYSQPGEGSVEITGRQSEASQAQGFWWWGI